MKKSSVTAVCRTAVATSAIIALFSIFACAAHVSRSEYGTVKINVGGERCLETGWPAGVTPTFGSVIVTVSAADMETISKTFSGGSGTIELSVPAGSNRLVQVEASPAAGGGAPYFALSYGGTATVDLSEGETTTATITLALTKTKILLQDYSAYALYTADSISGGLNSGSVQGVYFNETSDPCFDPYGRLYFYDAEMNYLYRFTASLTAPGQVSIPNISDNGTAYSPSNQRLYFFYNNEYWQLQYWDVTQTGEPSSVSIYPPSEVIYFQPVVAADETGSVYACAYDLESEESVLQRIVKMSIGAESANSAQATQVASVLYSAIGLTYAETPLTVRDLYAKDGVLYIAASEVIAAEYYPATSAYSRGKVVALRTSDLTKLWETGWSGDSNKFPTNSSTQFYGPVRFVGIAPKRIYVADDGFSWDGEKGGYHYFDVDRVVEINAETGAFAATGLNGEVSFFSAYSGTYVQNC